MTRPKWNEYFMEIAEVVAKRGTCLRRKVGAVIVDEKHRIIATGYNGAPSGLKQCDEVGCDLDPLKESCIRTLHAEMNAILHADSTRLNGATIYINSYSPCIPCAKLLIVAGIKNVYFSGAIYDLKALIFLGEAEVGFTQMKGSDD